MFLCVGVGDDDDDDVVVNGSKVLFAAATAAVRLFLLYIYISTHSLCVYICDKLIN